MQKVEDMPHIEKNTEEKNIEKSTEEKNIEKMLRAITTERNHESIALENKLSVESLIGGYDIPWEIRAIEGILSALFCCNIRTFALYGQIYTNQS